MSLLKWFIIIFIYYPLQLQHKKTYKSHLFSAVNSVWKHSADAF